MSIVHTLLDAQPPIRVDGAPWTQVKIQQALTLNDAWADLDTLALSPVDADPTEPMLRDLTFTSDAPAAYYRLIWLDAGALQSPPTAPIYDDGTGGSADDTLPSVADVGALLRARTRDKYGNEIGTFNEDTRPTAGEVQGYIQSSSEDVRARMPRTIPEYYKGLLRRTIAIRAAMMVELSYDPDRVGREGAWAALMSMFNESMTQLVNSMQDIEEGPRRHVGCIGVSSGTLSEAPDTIPSVYPHYTIEI